MKLEGFSSDLEFMDPNLRQYVLASVKAVLTLKNGEPKIPKVLPPFLNDVESVSEEDLSFLSNQRTDLCRQRKKWSKVLDVPVFLNGEDLFRHHVLIPATTGRGKSNLVKVMLWHVVGNSNFGILVLDPHDEYYGRHTKVSKTIRMQRAMSCTTHLQRPRNKHSVD